jgi:hypothetical protein
MINDGKTPRTTDKRRRRMTRADQNLTEAIQAATIGCECPMKVAEDYAPADNELMNREKRESQCRTEGFSVRRPILTVTKNLSPFTPIKR